MPPRAPAPTTATAARGATGEPLRPAGEPFRGGDAAESTRPTPTVPERPETLTLQFEAFERGDKPAVLLPPGVEPPPGLDVITTRKGTLVYNRAAVTALTRGLRGRTLEDRLRRAVEEDREGEILGYGVATKLAAGEPMTIVEARAPGGTEVQSIVAPSPAPPTVVASAARVLPPEGGSIRITPPAAAEARATEILGARVAPTGASVSVTDLDRALRLVAPATAPMLSPEEAAARADFRTLRFRGRAEREVDRNLAVARALAAQTGDRPPAEADIPPRLEDEPQRPGLLHIAGDYLTRPLAATAGAAKALVEGENPLPAVGRAVRGREKTTFADVLEAAGVPELGRVTLGMPLERSSPEYAETVRRLGLDPRQADVSVTGRGALGFALDVAADPLTYLTAGTGRGVQLGAKVAGRGAARTTLPSVTLSKAGEERLAAEIGRFRTMGLSKDSAREMAEQSLQHAVTQGTTDLVDRGGLKFAGVTIPGTPELATAARAGGRQLRRGAQAVAPQLVEKADQAVDGLGRVFSRDFGVRRFETYVDDKQHYLDLVNADKAGIIDEVKDLFAGTTKADRTAITRAVETERASGIQTLAQRDPRLGTIAQELADRQRALRAEEIARGLGETVRADYMLHVFTNYPRARGGRAVTGRVSTTLRSNEERIIPTLDDAKALGLKPLTEDAAELYALRRIASAKAQRAQDLLEATGRKFGREGLTPAEQQTLAEASRKLGQTPAPALTAAEQRVLADVGQRGVSLRQRITDDLVPLDGYRAAGDRAVFVPREIAQDLGALGGASTIPEALQPLVRGYDVALNFWKGAVTSIFPAFHARNAASNVALNFLDIGVQAANPARHAEVLGILRDRKGELVSRLGERYSYDEVRRLARERGIFGAFKGRAEFIETIGEELGTGGAVSRTVGSRNPLFRAGRTVGGAIEDEARLTNFVTNLRRGLSPDEAARRTKQFLFDYDNLSAFEKGVMRRAIPFYTFMRKNVELQARQLLQQPGKQAVFVKAFENLGDPDAQAREAPYLPEYVREGLAVRLGEDVQGNPLYLSGLGLPIEDLNKLLTPTQGDESAAGRTITKTFLAALSPLVKPLLELPQDRDLFLDEPISELDRVYNVYGRLLERAPEAFRDFVDFKKEFTRRGDVRYTVDPHKLYAVRNFVVARVYTTGGKFFDERKDTPSALLNALTGAKPNSIDLERQELGRGARRDFERVEASREVKEQARRRLMFRGRPGDTRGVANQ